MLEVTTIMQELEAHSLIRDQLRNRPQKNENEMNTLMYHTGFVDGLNYILYRSEL